MGRKRVILLAVICCIMFWGLRAGAGLEKVTDPKKAAEEFYFEKTTETFIDGESAGPEKKLQVWLKGDRIRFESEDNKDQYTIIMMDKGKNYELDKVQKTFKETSSEMNKLKEVNEGAMVISKRTGNKKKIGEWNTYEVFLDTTLQGNKMKATCWLTEEIKVSPKLIDKMAKFSQMKMMEELAKYPGYPVKLIMNSTVKGKQVKVLSTLTKISRDPIKDSFFQIPFEYSKVNP